MSISPRYSRAPATSSRTPFSVPTSPGWGYPPISCATAVAASKTRSLTTTRAPAAASPRASARPIPAPAPVTTTPAPLISTVTSAGYRAPECRPSPYPAELAWQLRWSSGRRPRLRISAPPIRGADIHDDARRALTPGREYYRRWWFRPPLGPRAELQAHRLPSCDQRRVFPARRKRTPGARGRAAMRSQLPRTQLPRTQAPRALPARPSLRHLKLEAKRRLAAGEFGTLHAAQTAIARE